MIIIFEVLFDFIGFKEYNILKDIEILWNFYIIYFIIYRFTINKMSFQYRFFVIEDGCEIQVVTDLILTNYLIATLFNQIV